MMKDQEEMLVMAYGRDTYKSEVDGTWVDEWTAWAQEATVATRQDRKQWQWREQ
jgi:hypothetical protein